MKSSVGAGGQSGDGGIGLGTAGGAYAQNPYAIALWFFRTSMSSMKAVGRVQPGESKSPRCSRSCKKGIRLCAVHACEFEVAADQSRIVQRVSTTFPDDDTEDAKRFIKEAGKAVEKELLKKRDGI